MKYYCFFHKVDFDGVIGAHSWYLHMPEIVDSPKILVPYNYGDNVSHILNSIQEDDHVHFIDCSLSPLADMLSLAVKVKRMFLMDHHISFMKSDEYAQMLELPNVHSYCTTEKSGCQIVNDFFRGSRNRPPLIQLAGDYDRWASDLPNWESEILPFQCYLKENVELDPFDHELHCLYHSTDMNREIEEGKVILQKEDRENAHTMERSFEVYVSSHNIRFLCINSTRGRGSQIFKSKWNPEYHDYMIWFMVTSKNNIPEITFSIYTTRKDRDASVVAKAMGGGGHKGAAGFICSPIGLLDILHTACELSNGGKC